MPRLRSSLRIPLDDGTEVRIVLEGNADTISLAIIDANMDALRPKVLAAKLTPAQAKQLTRFIEGFEDFDAAPTEEIEDGLFDWAHDDTPLPK